MNSKRPTIGVLALQGAFDLHRNHVLAAGADYLEVANKEDLEKVDGLIIPGGESSVMLKLLDSLSMNEPMARFVSKKPTWGICAGAILLAKKVSNPSQRSFAAIDIEIQRNGYGRQLDSSEELVEGYSVAYIRAPIITNLGNEVTTHHCRGSNPTWVESRNVMVTTFHPEISQEAPSPWHRSFVAGCNRISPV